jgi:hypothetical protein
MSDPRLQPRAVSPTLHPILWRAGFPERISSRLVSFNNPSGTITNSDLELAAEILQHDVAAQCCDARELSLATRPAPESFLSAPPATTALSTDGRNSAMSYNSASGSTTSVTQWPSSRSSPNGTEPEPLHPVTNPRELALWNSSYGPSAKRLAVWGPRTLD